MIPVGSERVINLGDMSADSGSTAAAATQGWGTALRRSVRRAAVPFLAALCTVTLTGSALPLSHGPRVLWRMPWAGQQWYTPTDEALYLQSPDGEVIAYDLADGSPRWAAQRAEASLSGVTHAGDVLLLSARDDSPPQDSNNARAGSSHRITAVDPRTGEGRWRAGGQIAMTGADRALLVDRDRTGSPAALRMIALADGRLVWERPMPEVRIATIDSNRLLTVTPGGSAQVIRLFDGVVTTTTGRFEWPSGAGDDSGANLSVQGDTVYVSHFASGGRRAVTAYALGTLRERWRLEGLDGNLQADCRPLFCLSDTLSTVAYDPGTGTPRWRVAGQAVPWPGPPDRLLMRDDRGPLGYSVLDAATGRVLASLGPGSPITLAGPQTFYLRSTKTPTGRVSVSRLDPQSGRLSVTGTIDQAIIDGCQAAGTRLVCPHLDGTLTVIAVA